jgi:GAF domain-containing protein
VLELQRIVDDLAERLDSPTVLEDTEERMVAYSSHSSPIDDVRRESILRRTTRRKVKAWFLQHGILSAIQPLRIPGHPEEGILGRLCVPVRYQGRLMGWLFLIDDEQRLTDVDMALACKAADQAAALLYEDELSAWLTSRSLAHLLSPAEELREAAAEQIAEQGLFPARQPCVVAVIHPLGLPVPAARERIGEALRDGARAAPGELTLRLGQPDHGVILTQADALEDETAGVVAAHEALAALHCRIRHLARARVVAAVGDPQPGLADAYLSYRQARLAAKVTAIIPETGGVIRWHDLGVFRILAQLPESTLKSALDPRVGALFATGDADLVNTLETYLEFGCDAKKTSAHLNLHRATLYYRLDKARVLSGADLRDGNDRLAIHLSLKLARLVQLHPYAT